MAGGRYRHFLAAGLLAAAAGCDVNVDFNPAPGEGVAEPGPRLASEGGAWPVRRNGLWRVSRTNITPGPDGAAPEEAPTSRLSCVSAPDNISRGIAGILSGKDNSDGENFHCRGNLTLHDQTADGAWPFLFTCREDGQPTAEISGTLTGDVETSYVMDGTLTRFAEPGSDRVAEVRAQRVAAHWIRATCPEGVEHEPPRPMQPPPPAPGA